jgi:hypothetical protein
VAEGLLVWNSCGSRDPGLVGIQRGGRDFCRLSNDHRRQSVPELQVPELRGLLLLRPLLRPDGEVLRSLQVSEMGRTGEATQLMIQQGKSAWAGYRKCRTIFWCSIPVGAVILAVTGGATWAAIILLGTVVVCNSRLQFFKCPGCGSHFFFKTFYLPWEKHCLHCGFPKWAEPDPGSGAPARKD